VECEDRTAFIVRWSVHLEYVHFEIVNLNTVTIETAVRI
jgi:hypothetical protein